MENSQDNVPVSVFVDIPYVAPDTTDDTKSIAQSGYIGGIQVTADGLQAGVEDGQVKYINDPGNERIVVGDPANPKAILGQLMSKSGLDEYGLWCTTGYFTGTVHATLGDIGGWDIDATTISTSTLILDSANEQIRSSNYVAETSGFLISSDLIEAQNIKARGALKGVAFQYDVVSAVGGQLMVANADTLSADMTTADNSTLTGTGSTAFAVNDILVIRGVAGSGIQEEYLRVTDVSAAPIYTVTRDLAGIYVANANPAWKKGTVVVKQGKSDGASTYSGGWLRLLGEGTNSPYYSVFTRTGVTYNNFSEVVRLGNLNGIGGFVADTYGIFIGNYSTGKYLTYDSATGNLNVNGYVQSSRGAFGGDGSDGALNITSGTTTIDCGGAAILIKNYSSISITGTGKLAFSNPNANGTLILLKSQGDVTLTSSATPMVDASGMGGSGGPSVSSPVNGMFYPGQAGNSGLTNFISAGGGLGATVTPTVGASGTITFAVNTTQQITTTKYPNAVIGGGGGSGCSAGTTAASGAGGRGGGGLIIECGGAWTFTTANGISVAGLPGGNGTGTVYVRGGGGGGGGGSFIGLYNTLGTNTGTVTVTGGAGGVSGGAGTNDQGGGGGSVTAGAGASGSTGPSGGSGYSLIAQNTVFA